MFTSVFQVRRQVTSLQCYSARQRDRSGASTYKCKTVIVLGLCMILFPWFLCSVPWSNASKLRLLLRTLVMAVELEL